jgi:hypothetical protein
MELRNRTDPLRPGFMGPTGDFDEKLGHHEAIVLTAVVSEDTLLAGRGVQKIDVLQLWGITLGRSRPWWAIIILSGYQ